MSKLKTLEGLEVSNKRVLLRVDLNVPLDGENVRDATRIDRILPTIQELLDSNAAIIMLSHMGRPKGAVVPQMSLRPVVPVLVEKIGRPVTFVETNWCDGTAVEAAQQMQPGEIIVLENTRFDAGEESNDPAFIKQLQSLGDMYVNDAFSTAHRAHASTEGLAHVLPSAAGRAMESELAALDKALGTPQHPVTAVIGGAKISSKLDLIGNLCSKVDVLIIGGAMANTFLAAQGYAVGKSLYEPDLLETAREILKTASEKDTRVILPVDVVVAQDFKAHAPSRVCPVAEVKEDEMILDIGTQSLKGLEEVFASAKTVVWNGPFGAFEMPPFDAGTNSAARMVAVLTKAGQLCSVAGGGDTVAALKNAGVADDFTFVSTAGGAFLEWLEGKELPGVRILEK
jgi:phosphoglycerate kinase